MLWDTSLINNLDVAASLSWALKQSRCGSLSWAPRYYEKHSRKAARKPRGAGIRHGSEACKHFFFSIPHFGIPALITL